MDNQIKGYAHDYNQFLDNRQLPDSIPYVHDIKQANGIVNTFVTEFINKVYTSEATLQADTEIKAFWDSIKSIKQWAIPLTKNNLKELLLHFIMNVIVNSSDHVKYELGNLINTNRFPLKGDIPSLVIDNITEQDIVARLAPVWRYYRTNDTTLYTQNGVWEIDVQYLFGGSSEGKKLLDQDFYQQMVDSLNNAQWLTYGFEPQYIYDSIAV
jgi:hypothetical protein